jgi:hypothetical protein
MAIMAHRNLCGNNTEIRVPSVGWLIREIPDCASSPKTLSLPKNSSRIEILAVIEIFSHSARSSGSSLFRWVCFAFNEYVDARYFRAFTDLLQHCQIE